MNRKKENIQRLKEAGLLLIFFFCFLSFSGKSLGHSAAERTKPAVTASAHIAKATLAEHSDLKIAAPPAHNGSLPEKQITSCRINSTTRSDLDHLDSRFRHIKPRIKQAAWFTEQSHHSDQYSC